MSEPTPEIAASESAIFVRHEDLWYEDGSVILRAGTTLFRVHRFILAKHSEVFADMFTVPQPEGEPMMDGCPLVNLPDNAADFEDLLNVLYDPWHFDSLPPTADLVSTIKFLSGLLRLSNKYYIQRLRQKSIGILKRKIPTTFADFTTSNEYSDDLSIYMNLINLARESNVPELLPFAFCQCTRMSPDQFFGPSSDILSWKDKTICLVGREKLIDAQLKFAHSFIANFRPSPECHGNPHCHMVLSNEDRMDSNFIARLYRCAFPLVQFATWNSLRTCQPCTAYIKTHHEKEQEKVWNQLPQIFQLGSWEEVRKDQNRA